MIEQREVEMDMQLLLVGFGKLSELIHLLRVDEKRQSAGTQGRFQGQRIVSSYGQ